MLQVFCIVVHMLHRDMSEIRSAFDSLTPSLTTQYDSTLSSASTNSDRIVPNSD